MSGPEDRDPPEGRGFVRVGSSLLAALRDFKRRLRVTWRPPEERIKTRCQERGYHLALAVALERPPNDKRHCLTCGADITTR